MQVVAQATCGDVDPSTGSCFSLSQRFVGSDTSWSAPGRSVMAAILGKGSHSHVQQKLLSLAAAQHYASRVRLESVLHHLSASIDRKDIKLRVGWKFFSSDSTTLPIGKLIWSSLPRDSCMPDGLSSHVADTDDDPTEETGPRAKVHQSDLRIAFLLERPDGERVALALPVVSPLQITDGGQASCLRTVWEENLVGHT
jgi:hypothetical protein